MADSNLKSILLLAALITGIGLIVISIIGLSVVGQVAYFILAVIDDSLWTDQYKFINGVNGTETTQYIAAKAQLDNDLSNITLALATAAIVIGLIGLVIVILVFFMKGGILDMIKGTRVSGGE